MTTSYSLEIAENMFHVKVFYVKYFLMTNWMHNIPEHSIIWHDIVCKKTVLGYNARIMANVKR